MEGIEKDTHENQPESQEQEQQPQPQEQTHEEEEKHETHVHHHVEAKEEEEEKKNDNLAVNYQDTDTKDERPATKEYISKGDLSIKAVSDCPLSV